METWRYDMARDIGRGSFERLRRFPREADMLVYALRWFSAVLIRAWLHSYHRLHVVGRERLPTEGSYVLIANHSSHLDTLCLISALPLRRIHRVYAAAAADYFFSSLSRAAVAAVIGNALPFHRKFHCCQSLTLCKELLTDPGNVLILFPEGTRSTSGAIGPFKPGIGKLLEETDVPVLPCHIAGAFEACPRGTLFPRPDRVRLLIGTPRRYASLPPGKESALQVVKDLQAAVSELAAMNRARP